MDGIVQKSLTVMKQEYGKTKNERGTAGRISGGWKNGGTKESPNHSGKEKGSA